MNYLYGLLDLSFWGYVTAGIVMVQITMMAVTLYLHRDAAHRSLDLHPVLRHFFRFWIWCTSGMLTREWVAVHRKHHAYCENTRLDDKRTLRRSYRWASSVKSTSISSRSCCT